MKRLKLRLLLLVISTVVTLGLSHVAAQACADYEVGGNAYGDYKCRFTHYCNGWCYYDCDCFNLFPGFSCNKVLEEAGFEIVAAPEC
jgi:hypothetical protein